ncbi:unnamed protein product [Caenorhabditis bovis]|uniref:JNK1/MAPK8-associated membrane protein n=1 Tax=Caenorhabditis bovis TaxID=2654633 RepID=A0A8S1EFX2_9PELO|nr:unnamed protein product [Caenorhabditis bovis]
MSLLADLVSTESTAAPSCLGFCGRLAVFNESDPNRKQWTNCAACPWGYRASKRSICEPCTSPLPVYDWMYLLFIALLPLLLHMQFIRSARKYCRTRAYEAAEHISCFMENLIAALVSLFVYPPSFSPQLYTCSKSSMREWYPTSYNPLIGYTKTMRCSYEVVFPLYSLPFLHYSVLFACIIVFRSTLYCILLHKTYNGKPFYYALLSLPLMAGIHGFFAGVLYYTFPILLLLGTIGATVYHLAHEGKRTIREMIVRVATSPTHLFLMLISMSLLAFSLIALASPNEISHKWVILVLVPLPSMFYLLTMPFSHPTVIGHSQ